MSEVLSQKEIDQLLSGINSGEIKENQLGSFRKNRDVHDFDFRRPNRVSKDQLKTIQNLHENFSEIFGFYLASKLQTMATIDLISVDQLRYSEYVLSISNPSCIYTFNIEETDGKAVLELNPELVLVIVERLLGGSGYKVNAARSITAIEQRMIRPLMAQALVNLTNAWRPIHELNFSLSGFESNPDFVQIAPASEIVIVISFEIKIGEDSYLMNLCYPSFTLEEVIARLNVQYYSSSHTPKDKQQMKENIQSHLQKTDMKLHVQLGQSKITINELLGLEKDDVLVLDTEIDNELPIFIEDKLRFLGRPGVADNQLAVKITNEISQ